MPDKFHKSSEKREPSTFIGDFRSVHGVSGLELEFEKKAEFDKYKLEGVRGKA